MYSVRGRSAAYVYPALLWNIRNPGGYRASDADPGGSRERSAGARGVAGPGPGSRGAALGPDSYRRESERGLRGSTTGY